ncbi:BamA/TamA family outer membrane protein [Cloacibacillus porcorum]|uniref:BamA/OMP85 family outer membrane protein n=1 Tax=Cloacibacillus porcorum TaxID=1197717 RepID=UPI0014595941|nr:POTRA domain-containing protein [Cloacibacillus porcorum]MCC8185417.1 BamA/TamA family outer membrane protein [Cloacibacillus porcorum]MDY5389376.1 POTRA domain-containing protein [Cloacibacillus porcorum]NMF18294.1 BamA/TamA family outer membrane protein [Cloacibacillus porcorum]
MLKRAKPFALALIIVAFAATSALSAEENALENAAGNIPSAQTETVSADKPQEPAPAPEEEDLTGPVIVSMDLQGNQEVNRDHIMSVVTSKVGQHVDEEKLRKDAEAIFELGFFNATDYKVTDEGDGVKVTFLVQENPKVGEIKFVGNTVYSEDKLKSAIFTQPGMIFNRTFFRNDLQRIKEKYQEDGYVMANVKDVKIDGDVITVEIIEPKISEIVIQGNKITKKKIIERYLKIKVGELFNANKLRLTLNRLQGLGYFSDVNVNFEPGENPDDVIIVLTVEEARTGKLGFNVAYGTQSGFGGGMSYENFNIGGAGLKLSVGFELGDREEYWLSFEQPYMSGKIAAWKVGIYKRAWDDVYYYDNDKQYLEYDRDKYGAFIGFGKKFRDESKYNWYMLLDWHNTKNDNVRERDGFREDFPNDAERAKELKRIKEEELGEGTYYSATLSFRRFNIDEYLPYTRGDVESLSFQFGKANVEDTDYNYMKYWLESKFYFPVGNFLKDIFETTFLNGYEDKPVLFAARLIAGSSTGDVPYDEMYTVGGDTTLRGYDDDYYRGRNMVLGNFELRIPMQKMLSFVLFYDVGRAWDMGSYSSKGNDDWGSSPGIGIRLNTPLGNLRLDYADGDEGRFHFGFGELF